MKDVLENFPNQCKNALELGNDIKINNINKVIVTGIGGSAFSGEVLKTIVNQEIEVTINRDYNLPKNINENTLVFVLSYSGNTEETLSALNDAIKNNCKIIGIGSGGKLQELCKDFIKVPKGIQPRNALGYLCIPMINVLQNNNLIQKKIINIEDLKNKEIQEQGKKIADLLFNKIPLIYSSERLKCISYGWKTRINENTKIHAFSHQFPELNHNELVGYTKNGEFYTIIIRDKDDFERIKKGFSITKDVIEEYKGECTIIDTIGSDLTSRIFSTIHLGDWVSYHLALKYSIDPEPVKIIENLKKQLKSL